MPFNYSATFNAAMLNAISSNPAAYSGGRYGGYYGGGGYGYNRNVAGGVSTADPAQAGGTISAAFGDTSVTTDNTDPRVKNLQYKTAKKNSQLDLLNKKVNTYGNMAQTGVAAGLGTVALFSAINDLFNPPTVVWLDAPESAGTTIRRAR